MNRSAFFAAADHLHKGAELLGCKERMWGPRGYDFCLELHEKLAEVQMIFWAIILRVTSC
jgi:hypothetical protein